MKHPVHTLLALAVLYQLMAPSARAENPGDVVQTWSERLLAEATRRAEIAEEAVQDHAAASHDPEPLTVERMLPSVAPDGPLPDLIRKILRDEGVPENLIALAKVESGLSPLALSPKGARGIWQLMPDTARNFGLMVDTQRDDRVDPIRSTIGAARFLKSLHSRWGDWNLVFAAYNAGSGAVERATAGDEAWSIRLQQRLPAETREYVPKVWREIYRIDPSGLSDKEAQR